LIFLAVHNVLSCALRSKLGVHLIYMPQQNIFIILEETHRLP